MTAVPLWHGRVLSGGLLVLDRPQDYGRYTRTLAGRFVELVLRRQRTQRSLQQNAYYHGVIVALITEHCGYTHDEAHDALKYEFLRVPGDGPLVKVRSTADLNTEEFENYMDRIRIWAATKLDVIIPFPNEVIIPDPYRE